MRLLLRWQRRVVAIDRVKEGGTRFRSQLMTWIHALRTRRNFQGRWMNLYTRSCRSMIETLRLQLEFRVIFYDLTPENVQSRRNHQLPCNHRHSLELHSLPNSLQLPQPLRPMLNPQLGIRACSLQSLIERARLHDSQPLQVIRVALLVNHRAAFGAHMKRNPHAVLVRCVHFFGRTLCDMELVYGNEEIRGEGAAGYFLAG